MTKIGTIPLKAGQLENMLVACLAIDIGYPVADLAMVPWVLWNPPPFGLELVATKKY